MNIRDRLKQQSVIRGTESPFAKMSAEALTEIQKLDATVAMLKKAAERVLSDVDDDGVAERGDMAVLALRNAVQDAQCDVLFDLVVCARRVYSKFGHDSDWSEWKDLGKSIEEFDGAHHQ